MVNKIFTLLMLLLSFSFIIFCNSNPDNGDAGNDETLKHPLTEIIESNGNTNRGYTFADTITDYTGEEQVNYPKDNALNGVRGKGKGESSLDVFVLGEGKQAVFSWSGKRIINGAGVFDFKIFENGFYSGNSYDRMSLDLGTIEVSKDGIDWISFPVKYSSLPYANSPIGKVNFVGANPVYLNMSDDVLIYPSLNDAGGDGFDLSSIGISEGDYIKYIKIIDGGDTYLDGQIQSNGLDIDGVCAFYWENE